MGMWRIWCIRKNFEAKFVELTQRTETVYHQNKAVGYCSDDGFALFTLIVYEIHTPATVAVIFLADGTVFSFFGVILPASVKCLNCCFD